MTRYLKLFFFFAITTVFSFCNGQQASDTVLKRSDIVIGDTVLQTHDSILSIFEDSKNNFWFGSNGYGAYRYDGKALVRFTTKHGLCKGSIWKIQEDNQGNIYITTTGGINKFDGKNFTTLKARKSVSPDKGWKLQADDLWFQGAQDSGVIYRYDGETLYRLEFPKTKVAEDFIREHPRSKYPNMKFNPYDVFSIFKDKKGNLWFGTGMLGVCRYDGKSFNWIPNSEIEMDEIAFCVRSIIEDQNGNFWFSNTKHCYSIKEKDTGEQKISWEKEKGITTSIEDNLTYFMSGFEDKNSDLWFATYGAGVWRYKGKNVIRYPIKKVNTNVTIFSIYKDNNGGIWLGTHTDGAYKFNGKTFEKFRF